MTHTFKSNDIGAFFGVTDDFVKNREVFDHYDNLIFIYWNRSGKAANIIVDDVQYDFPFNSVLTTTYLQKITLKQNTPPLVAFGFNREFYCIQDHDHEVSCNGIIFLGRQETPIVSLDDSEVKKYTLLLDVFNDEFMTRDNIQGEMLRMLLKRLIIKTTRLAKDQLIPQSISDHQIDLIRKYNVLVDIHYKEKRLVSEYAELLHKSPKTLSNIFAENKQKSPLQIIHERQILEAKRMLIYSDLSIKQISFELGFDSPSSFHKLFKRVVGATPADFREDKSQLKIK